MKYKLVALDIDGTLIDENHNIPEKNVQVIKKLKNQGVKFVIVTGRVDLLAMDIVKKLEIEVPILGCNGATVRNLFSNETFYIKEIKKEAIKKVVEFFLEKKIWGRMFGEETVYYFGNNGEVFDESYRNRVSKHLKMLEVDSSNINDVIEKDQITKIVYINNDFLKITKLQEEMKILEEVETFRAAKNCIDIVAKGASKGKALLEYAKELGIGKEEIVAIGDGENDFSMLSEVGYPVTMENGEECLKKIAKFITKSNEEAGVAFALEKIFGIEKGTI